MIEAAHYDKLEQARVKCNLCPHHCVIDSGKIGACGVRENRSGALYSHVYGSTTVRNVDPVEKKPLYHYYPGSRTYSISTYGCNMHCPYCINWQLSQAIEIPEAAARSESCFDIVAAAIERGCETVGYTYVEPAIFFEYVLAVSKHARNMGLRNVMKSNGFITEPALEELAPCIDAANIDLKSFREKSYRFLGGRLEPVLNTLLVLKRAGIWCEVTTVVVPGVNDDPIELAELAGFISRELGESTPWHIVRFFPAFQMQDTPPTPIKTLHQARDIGRAQGLKFVYIGNLLEDGVQDTLCAICGAMLVKRRGTAMIECAINAGSCPKCGAVVAGVGMAQIPGNRN